jgi:RNA polymerase sigma-70 factor, ECF subfamily
MRVAHGVEACFSNRASRVRHIDRALRRCSPSPKPLFPGHGGSRKSPATQVFHFLQGNPYPGRLVAVILSREKVPVTPERAFDIYHEAVFRFVYRLTRRADVAEDGTQECFLTLVRAPGRFNEARGSLKTYLFAIARNLALKHHRDRAADVQLDEDTIGHRAPDPTTPELSAAIERAVAALPPLQQEALMFFEYEGFTLEETARVCGTDVGTIKSRLHRARERLRRTLAPLKKVGDPYGTAGRSRTDR